MVVGVSLDGWVHACELSCMSLEVGTGLCKFPCWTNIPVSSGESCVDLFLTDFLLRFKYIIAALIYLFLCSSFLVLVDDLVGWVLV